MTKLPFLLCVTFGLLDAIVSSTDTCFTCMNLSDQWCTQGDTCAPDQTGCQGTIVTDGRECLSTYPNTLCDSVITSIAAFAGGETYTVNLVMPAGLACNFSLTDA